LTELFKTVTDTQTLSSEYFIDCKRLKADSPSFGSKFPRDSPEKFHVRVQYSPWSFLLYVAKHAKMRCTRVVRAFPRENSTGEKGGEILEGLPFT
jgi:hypothetical protein